MLVKDVTTGKDNKAYLSECMDLGTHGILVTGPEGCSKSMTVIEIMIKMTKPNEVSIISSVSYEQLYQKKQDIMKRFRLTSDECPIVTTGKYNVKYKDYYHHKTPEHICIVPAGAKIILVPQAVIINQSYKSLVFSEMRTPKIRYILVDEFELNSGILPSINYVMESLVGRLNPMDINNNEGVDRDKYIAWLKSNYSWRDIDKFREADDNGLYQIAGWIDGVPADGIQLIIASSEMLPYMLLQHHLNFTEVIFGEDKMDEIAYHKVKCQVEPYLNQKFFEILNAENKWKDFGYKQIVSDKHTVSDCDGNDYNVYNHQVVKGQNRLMGKDVLYIMGHIPDGVIEFLFQAFKSLSGNDMSLSKESIKAFFYRDRLCQSLGRTIGYRGIYTNTDTANLILHKRIYDLIIKYESDLNFLYTINVVDSLSEDISKVTSDINAKLVVARDTDKKENVEQKKVIAEKRKCKTEASTTSDKNALKLIMDEHIQYNTKKCITNYDLNKLMKNEKITYRGKHPYPALIASLFGRKTIKVQLRKSHAAIQGLEFKHSYEIGIILDKDPSEIVDTVTCFSYQELSNVQLENHTLLANCTRRKRDSRNFTSVRFLQFDFDENLISPEDIHARLSEIKHYIMASRHDTPEHRKFHLFVETETITNLDRYKEVSKNFLLYYEITDMRDEKASDATRIFYKHKSLLFVNETGILYQMQFRTGFELAKFYDNITIKDSSISKPVSASLKSIGNESVIIRNPYLPQPSMLHHDNINLNRLADLGPIGCYWDGVPIRECDLHFYIDNFLTNYCRLNNKSFSLTTDGQRWKSMCAISGLLSVKGLELPQVFAYIESNAAFETDSKRHFTRSKVYAQLKKDYP